MEEEEEEVVVVVVVEANSGHWVVVGIMDRCPQRLRLFVFCEGGWFWEGKVRRGVMLEVGLVWFWCLGVREERREKRGR